MAKSSRNTEHRILRRGYVRVVLAVVGVLTVAAMVLAALKS